MHNIVQNRKTETILSTWTTPETTLCWLHRGKTNGKFSLLLSTTVYLDNIIDNFKFLNQIFGPGRQYWKKLNADSSSLQDEYAIKPTSYAYFFRSELLAKYISKFSSLLLSSSSKLALLHVSYERLIMPSAGACGHEHLTHDTTSQLEEHLYTRSNESKDAVKLKFDSTRDVRSMLHALWFVDKCRQIEQWSFTVSYRTGMRIDFAKPSVFLVWKGIIQEANPCLFPLSAY